MNSNHAHIDLRPSFFYVRASWLGCAHQRSDSFDHEKSGGFHRARIIACSRDDKRRFLVRVESVWILSVSQVFTHIILSYLKQPSVAKPFWFQWWGKLHGLVHNLIISKPSINKAFRAVLTPRYYSSWKWVDLLHRFFSSNNHTHKMIDLWPGWLGHWLTAATSRLQIWAGVPDEMPKKLKHLCSSTWVFLTPNYLS